MKVKKVFTPEKEKRVEAAIRNAEMRTSGEIVPLVVDQSDAYPHLPFVGGMLGLLAGSLAGVWLSPGCNVLLLLCCQVLGFAVGFLSLRTLSFPRRALLSPKLAEEEVFERALRAFRDLEMNLTQDRTGVLILVSLLEHRVQVLADSGINARVKPGTWNEVVDIVLKGIRGGDLCAGLCDAIKRCGEILEHEFPRQEDDQNELPDRLHKH
jgi:putative membrane protein